MSCLVPLSFHHPCTTAPAELLCCEGLFRDSRPISQSVHYRQYCYTPYHQWRKRRPSVMVWADGVVCHVSHLLYCWLVNQARSLTKTKFPFWHVKNEKSQQIFFSCLPYFTFAFAHMFRSLSLGYNFVKRKAYLSCFARGNLLCFPRDLRLQVMKIVFQIQD